jgi:YVTN family beta-propeller protein
LARQDDRARRRDRHDRVAGVDRDARPRLEESEARDIAARLYTLRDAPQVAPGSAMTLRSLAVLVLLTGCRTTAPAAAPRAAPPSAPSAVAASVPPARATFVYVSNEGSNDVTVIDAAIDEVVATIPVGKRPRGLRVSPDGRWLYVALSGSPRAPPGVDESTLPPADRAADGIGVVDVQARRLVRVLASGQDPESFDLALDGTRLYVSNEETATASVVDVALGEVVATVPVGDEPEGVRTSPDGRFVYVTSEGDDLVTVIDTTTNRPIAAIPTARRPRAVEFTLDGTLAFVTCELGAAVTVVDARGHRAIGAIPLGEGALPMGAALSPDGATLNVTTGRARAVAFLDVASRVVRRTVEDVGKRPWGIAVTPDGRKLFVANGPSNDVAVVDAVSGAVLKRIPAGELPWGVAIAPSPGGAPRP